MRVLRVTLLVVQLGRAHALGHEGDGREVHHSAHPLPERPEEVEHLARAAQVHLGEHEPPPAPRHQEVHGAARAAREVVQPEHADILLQRVQRGVRADEAGAARDHHAQVQVFFFARAGLELELRQQSRRCVSVTI